MFSPKKNISGKLRTTWLSKREWLKTEKDLRLIALATEFGRQEECRLIVSGGYAIDGSLGQITRPHRDVDLQIFGQIKDTGQLINRLVKMIKEKESDLSALKVTDKGRQEFYHAFFIEGSGLGVDVYCVRVVGNPFSEQKYVVKKDGSRTEKQRYDTVRVKLGEVFFEAVNPVSSLADILYKRKIRGDQPKLKHRQDIANLRLITDSSAVKARIEAMR